MPLAKEVVGGNANHQPGDEQMLPTNITTEAADSHASRDLDAIAANPTWQSYSGIARASASMGRSSLTKSCTSLNWR